MQDKQYETPPFDIPVDGKAVFQIGDMNFNLDTEKSNIEVKALTKSLGVEVYAKLSEFERKRALKIGLLDTYSEEIGFDVNLKQIFNKDVPQGSFRFEESKTNAPLFLHIYCRGFEFSLKFYGNVELQQGWVGINGVLTPPYADTPEFKVKIYQPIDKSALDWKNYNFTLDEALQADPKSVCYLSMPAPQDPNFPDEILNFTQLKSLTIAGKYEYSNPEENYSPLNAIPDSIGSLNQLEFLSITNTHITQLPETIGKLKHLEHVVFMNNMLEEIPASIMQLPKLKYLTLDNNRLQQLPSDIDLPALFSLSLNKNQLLTLPEKIAAQPCLQRLAISQNPFESLPDNVNHIKEIELELEEKKRLLDFSYKGADGKGMIAWDDELFFARNDQKLQQQLTQAINNTVLESHQKALEKVALKAVCLQTGDTEDDYSNIGNTRFGGKPDLPQGLEYPRFDSEYYGTQVGLQFIAQLNCEELAPFQSYLPRNGILYFFLQDQESFDCKVIYSNAETLTSAKQLDITDEEIGDDDGLYKPFKATANNMIAIPHFYREDPLFKDTSLENFEDSSEIDQYHEIQDELSKKLGVKGIYQSWNDCYYPDSHHAINTYMFSQQESPQERAALVKKGNIEDWVVLLKVYSDNNCGFCFWDAGEISFVIHKSDLAKADFSNVYCTLESS